MCGKEQPLASYDLIVRGAGIIGLSCAWTAVRRGAKVLVVDPAGPGAGSSGGIVGALAPHVPENWNAKKQFQLESLLMAPGFWAEVAAAGGADPGYCATGRLQPVQDEAALSLARQREETAALYWQDKAEWRVMPAAQDDWTPIAPTGWMIRDSLSAHLHPRRACKALVAALRTYGVQVVTQTDAVAPTLWATDVAGLADLTATHRRSMGTGVKGQAALLSHDARGKAQLLVGGVHIIPHADGTVAVGSTSERDYATPDQTDAQLDAVIEKAREAVPALAGARVIARWAGVRPRARSRAPMLGGWPGRPGHFVANGGFKIGFGMAPKVAEVMADLMLDGQDAIPEGFRVEDNF